MTVGATRELHASSIGKAILASMEEEPRERLLAQLKYPKLTEHTLRSRAQYERSLEEGRKRGYWTNISESSPDLMGIALPVRIFGDLYGINLVGPKSRFDKNLKAYVEALKRGVDKVGRAAGSLYNE
jgi:DNA-binding IclR family transcriptional regulator